MKLMGQLDAIGTNQIENQFAGFFSGDRVQAIVDMSEVDFVASIGIRLLVLTAKSVRQRGGRMVLLSPTPEVHHILDLAGIVSIIPVYTSLESALAVAGAA